MNRINFELFQGINRWGGQFPLLDNVMISFTNSVPYVAVILIMFLWFSRKRYTALYAFFSVCAALTINAVIHFFYYHPRPFVSHHVHQLVPHVDDSSFVSDHSVLVFSLAWILWMRNERLKILVFVWAIFVGLSRIYIGVHYPMDVIGGILLSLFTSFLVLFFSERLETLIQLLFRLYSFLSNLFPLQHRQEKQKQQRKRSI